MTDSKRMRKALAKIVAILQDMDLNGGESCPQTPHSRNSKVPGCAIRSLPQRLIKKASAAAIRINPVNAISVPHGPALAAMGIIDPMRIAVLTAKYWGPRPRRLTVSFMESASSELKKKILSHMNAWTKTACISFVLTGESGQVRISREGDGYWSYLGTDIQQVPSSRPTMNLERFTTSTDDSEHKRVVRHETGHTLGFPHEHMRRELVARLDREATYDYFLTTQGWDRDMVDAQVLTPLDEKTIMGTPTDQTSIMCYQFPSSITNDHRPILGGNDINSTDYRFASTIYPQHGSSAISSHDDYDDDNTHGDDWDVSEDVDDSDL